MTDISLKIDGLEEFKADVAKGASNIGEEVKRAMVYSVNTVKNTAQDMVAYKTGTLRRSIFTDVQDSGFTGIVGQDRNMASYGSDIEYGTAPHVILPVNKKALFWKGALNPYRKVNHPGTKPKPFMQPALDSSVERIKEFFDQAILNIIKMMSGK